MDRYYSTTSEVDVEGSDYLELLTPETLKSYEEFLKRERSGMLEGLPISKIKDQWKSGKSVEYIRCRINAGGIRCNDARLVEALGALGFRLEPLIDSAGKPYYAPLTIADAIADDCN